MFIYICYDENMPRGINISNNIKTEELFDLHWNQGFSIREIQERLGYSRQSTGLYQLFKKRGIPNRDRKEALVIRSAAHPEDWFKNRPRGANHHKWNGGKRTNNGYILILKPGHPRADPSGYVREHLVVWEENHGKPVPMGWVIHHLNGIRKDNRPENLLAVSRGKHEHQTFVKTLQTRIRELEQLRFSI